MYHTNYLIIPYIGHLEMSLENYYSLLSLNFPCKRVFQLYHHYIAYLRVIDNSLIYQPRLPIYITHL